jgi:hypothetical protein
MIGIRVYEEVESKAIAPAATSQFPNRSRPGEVWMMEACAAGIGLCSSPVNVGKRSSLDGARDTKIPVWGGDLETCHDANRKHPLMLF